MNLREAQNIPRNQKHFMDKPNFQRKLSSLSSQISKWNTSRSNSPVKKVVNQKNRQTNQSQQSNPATLLDATTNQDNVDEIYRPWYDKYSPTSLEDVAMHKRKLKDVAEELESMINGHSPNRILLLTGPSGSSKSTVIKQLSKKLIPFYRNEINSGLTSLNLEKPEYIEYQNDTVLNDVSTIDHFKHFLNQAKYKISSNLSLILIEDLPNVFHLETRIAFRRALLEWLYDSDVQLPPLVISLTECEIENDQANFKSFNIDTTFTAETVLGKEILSHSGLKRIKFNPINATLMKCHLTNICLQNKNILVNNGKWPLRDVFIRELSLSSGDLRSAISTLEFWSTSNVDILMFTRKEAISYFHGIGKIIHGSREIADDNEMINNLFLTSKDLLLNDNFKLGLLENYGIANKGKFLLEDAVQITDGLSQSDILKNNIESVEYAARKVRYISGNRNIQDSLHGKASFPREWKIRKLQDEFKLRSEDFTNISIYKYRQPQLLKNIALYDGFYAPKIRKQRNYKKKALEFYLTGLLEHDEKRLQILDSNKETFEVDESIDIYERIGNDINFISGEEKIVATEGEEENGITKRSIDYIRMKKDQNLQRLIETYNQDDFYESYMDKIDKQMFENDPILDDDDDDDESDCETNEDIHLIGEIKSKTGNSSILDEDDSILEYLSQKPPRFTKEKLPFTSESLSDSDLENL